MISLDFSRFFHIFFLKIGLDWRTLVELRSPIIEKQREFFYLILVSFLQDFWFKKNIFFEIFAFLNFLYFLNFFYFFDFLDFSWNFSSSLFSSFFYFLKKKNLRIFWGFKDTKKNVWPEAYRCLQTYLVTRSDWA